jgi:hypothetical protein
MNGALYYGRGGVISVAGIIRLYKTLGYLRDPPYAYLEYAGIPYEK